MKIGIIVLCRFSSSRLPGKILMEIAGDTLLNGIIKRLSKSKHHLPIVVATSNHHTDDILEEYCLDNNIEVFRGSLDNVANRFLSCAQAYEMDYAVRINGDNLFTDPGILDEMVEIALKNRYDFISNVEGRTFPHGMSVEIVRMRFYADIVERFDGVDLREHVTLYLYETPELGKRVYYKNQGCPFKGQIQVAIDTIADVEMAEKIISFTSKSFIDLTYCEIVDIYKSLNK